MASREVVLVNPNRLLPPVPPYALDLLASALTAASFPVSVLDLTWLGEEWAAGVSQFFAERPPPLLIGVTLRNIDNLSFRSPRVFAGEHKAVVEKIRQCAPGVPLVGGGAGFSLLPHALLEYLALEYGCRGRGERLLVRLAFALERGRPPPRGLLVEGGEANEGGGDIEEVPLFSSGRTGGRSERWLKEKPAERRAVDNMRYYAGGGLGSLLSRDGCDLDCSYCAEPVAKGRCSVLREPRFVAAELESLAQQGIHDIHSADSEFNVPLAHSEAVLEEIARRRDSSPGLREVRLWVSLRPTAESATPEYARLLARAGVAGVIASFESPTQLEAGIPVSGYSLPKVDVLAAFFAEMRRFGIFTALEVVLGLPGETPRTVQATLDKAQACACDACELFWGVQVLPGTPLAWRLEREGTTSGLRRAGSDGPVRLRPLPECRDAAEYERQFLWGQDGKDGGVFYLEPAVAELAKEKEASAPASPRARMNARQTIVTPSWARAFREKMPT